MSDMDAMDLLKIAKESGTFCHDCEGQGTLPDRVPDDAREPHIPERTCPTCEGKGVIEADLDG